MKNRRKHTIFRSLMLFTFSLFLFLFSAPAMAATGWDGTESSEPVVESIDGKEFYLIDTPQELAWFRDQVNNGQGRINARLTADIDLNGHDFAAIGSPDGTRFNGLFYGMDRSISNFIPQSADGGNDYRALFGCTGPEAEVFGLTLKQVTLHGGGDYHAGLVALNEGAINNCEIQSGSIGGGRELGGIAGSSSGLLLSCGNEADIRSDSTSGEHIGGVVGSNQQGEVYRCYNKGTVSSNRNTTGGIAGYSNGQILHCYNRGEIRGNNMVGGICGYFRSDDAHLRYCYNTGRVSGSGSMGGICGMLRNHASYIDCYYLEGSAAYAYCDGDGRGYADTDYCVTEDFMQDETHLLNVLNGGTESPMFAVDLYDQNQGFPVLSEENLPDYVEVDESVYADLGLSMDIPDAFEEDIDPLENFKTTVIQELYMDLGAGNSNYARTLENSENGDPTELFDDSHDIQYTQRSNNWDYRSTNFVPIDWDGDGKQNCVVRCGMGDTDNSSDKDDFIEYTLIDAKTGGDLSTSFRVILNNDDGNYIGDIAYHETLAYSSMAAGDFDGDGCEELAVYIPQRIAPRVVIFEIDPNATYQFMESQYINLADIDAIVAGNFVDEYPPVVSMTAVTLRGEKSDDLAFTLSLPLHDVNRDKKDSVIALYNFAGEKPELLFKDDLSWSDKRMRFANAVEGDLDGDGVDELVIAGNLLNSDADFKNRNSLNANKNLVNSLAYDTVRQRWTFSWDSPKELSRNETLIRQDIQEPVAMACANVDGLGADELFVESVLYELTDAGNIHELTRAGIDNGYDVCFISRAVAGCFDSQNMAREQIVFTSQDNSYRLLDDNSWFVDIWMLDFSGGYRSTQLVSDIISDSDEYGNWVCLAAVNVDEDSVEYKYVGKTIDVTSPSVFAVMMAPPSYRSLDYSNCLWNRGNTSFTISSGSGASHSDGFNIGGGMSLGISLLVGGGAVGNEVLAGGGFDIAASFAYCNDWIESKNTSYAVSFVAGGDEDHVVLWAIPRVTYDYNVWVPSCRISKEYIDNYFYSLGRVCPYEEGEMIGGHWEQSLFTYDGEPCFSLLGVSQYDRLADPVKNGLQPLKNSGVLTHEIGDPNSYPSTEVDLTAQGVEPVYSNPYLVNVGLGNGVVQLSADHSSSKSTSWNISIGIGGKIYAVVNGHVSAGVAAEFTGQLGLDLKCDYTHSETLVSSSGNGFSGAISQINLDPAEQQAGAYPFQVQLAVGKMTAWKDGPFVISYLVTEDEAIPHRPLNFSVSMATEDSLLLTWEDGTEPRGVYNIYIADSHGEPILLKANIPVTQHFYLVRSLAANTEYRFWIKAVDESAPGAKESALGEAVSGWTLPDDGAPQFEVQPADQGAPLGESVTLSATGCSYQSDESVTCTWQRLYSSGWGTVKEEICNGKFNTSYTIRELISPSDLTQYSYSTATNGTRYRLLLTERINGAFVSTASRVATVYTDQYIPQVMLNVTGAGKYLMVADVSGDGQPLADGEVSFYAINSQGDLVFRATSILSDNGLASVVWRPQQVGSYYLLAFYSGGESHDPGGGLSKVWHSAYSMPLQTEQVLSVSTGRKNDVAGSLLPNDEDGSLLPNDEPVSQHTGFEDVDSEDWFAGSVAQVAGLGLMQGTADRTFAPNEPMTRAMVITALGRLSGESIGEITTSSFGDVSANSWYGKYTEWGLKNNIIKGVDAGKYSPDDMLTREQMATLLLQYCRYQGKDLLGAWVTPLTYSDQALISDWANEGVMYGAVMELMNGYPDKSFRPQSYLTRAETAAILIRLHKMMAE